MSNEKRLVALGRKLDQAHLARETWEIKYPGVDDNHLYDRHWSLRESINQLHAYTFAGLKVKARAAGLALHFDPDAANKSLGSFYGLARSIIADIERVERSRVLSRTRGAERATLPTAELVTDT